MSKRSYVNVKTSNPLTIPYWIYCPGYFQLKINLNRGDEKPVYYIEKKFSSPIDKKEKIWYISHNTKLMKGGSRRYAPSIPW